MAKKKSEEVAEEVAEVTAEVGEAVAVNAQRSGKTEVVVKFRDHAGNPTERTFSKEVHGDDFAKLAEEFKATNASRIINE